MTDLGEKSDRLSLLALAPAIWAAHFLLSYMTAAIWCAKVAGPDGALGGARSAIGVYTVVALAGIGVAGWIGYRKWRSGSGSHDPDTTVERRRFIGFATLLLSGLSAVATAYVALAALFIETCS
jgi:hypothetical protein